MKVVRHRVLLRRHQYSEVIDTTATTRIDVWMIVGEYNKINK